MIRTLFGEEWTLLDEYGETAVDFTSFLDIDIRSEGRALSYPVELGGFAAYNKTESPLEIRVALAAQGSESDFARILLQLEDYKREAVRLVVVTPSALHPGMTLKGYSYKRGRDAGAGLLAVELNLVEAREVETRVAAAGIGKPKNPTSAGRTDTGKTQTADAPAGAPR
ncbi:MAG: hypothetical protein LBP61_08905 [Desulfovibrio sp.]|jgi:hypothetical protein|nr:hypothetical protein [Desulfovibrio sp.]